MRERERERQKEVEKIDRDRVGKRERKARTEILLVHRETKRAAV